MRFKMIIDQQHKIITRKPGLGQQVIATWPAYKECDEAAQLGMEVRIEAMEAVKDVYERKVQCDEVMGKFNRGGAEAQRKMISLRLCSKYVSPGIAVCSFAGFAGNL